MTWGPATMVAMLMVFASAQAAPAAPPDYDDYRVVLMAFVDEKGLVDYQELQNNQFGDLADFVRYLNEVRPQDYAGWSKPDQIAFWINAYNALTLNAIVHNYPIPLVHREPNLSYPKNSIRQIPGVFDRMRVHVMGEEITLQYIETKHLREDLKEPRIHMALVCAAMSCPKLRREPYEGAKLEQQLDDQARSFMVDSRHVRLDHEHGVIHASEIFRWYAADFLPGTMTMEDTRENKVVRSYARKYLGADREFIQHARIEYTPYDWSLNEQPR